MTPNNATPPPKGPTAPMVYPEMARDAVLFGGTDPGRFCPTYMIFCESFIPHSCQPEQDQNFDRRDVYIITQNALADNTYLDYIRAQFNRSAQIDPPFFQNFLSGSLPQLFHGPTRSLAWLDDIFESLGRQDRISPPHRHLLVQAGPVHQRRGSGGQTAPERPQDALSKYLYGQLSKETQALVDGKGDEKAPAPRFGQGFQCHSARRHHLRCGTVQGNHAAATDRGRRMGQNNIPATIIRLNRRMLEEAYPGDIVKSLGGVYPDTEIYHAAARTIPQQCFNDYLEDAQSRLQHDTDFPNEPQPDQAGRGRAYRKRARPGFGGQVAVMSINGLLTKVIFDKNPGPRILRGGKFSAGLDVSAI